MNRRKAENIARLYSRLEEMGFSAEETSQLIRIERRLSRWAELECNGVIQREGDDGDGEPYGYNPITGNRWPIPDVERGALRRLDKIMAEHPDYLAYHQPDPRGCAVYIVSKADLGSRDIRANYTVGVPVCVD